MNRGASKCGEKVAEIAAQMHPSQLPSRILRTRKEREAAVAWGELRCAHLAEFVACKAIDDAGLSRGDIADDEHLGNA